MANRPLSLFALRTWQLGLLVVTLGVWHFATRSQEVAFFFGEPLIVAQRIWAWFVSEGDIYQHLGVTLAETVLAFAIGTATGLGAGLWLALSPAASAVLDPYIKAANSMPRVILAPIFGVWFGLGIWSKVALAVTLVFLIVFFNVYQGVKEVSPVVLANARMLGASQRQLLRFVYLPSATSWVFSSLHTSVGFAVVGAVVGEYLGSAGGLGYLIQQAEGVFDVAGVFAGMFVLAAFVILIDLAVTAAGLALARATPYAPKAERGDNGAAPMKLLRPGTAPVYLAIALSGATGLAAEAVWTRMLSLLLGATTYTFSLILGAFLIGLGIGSSVGAGMARTSRDPRRALGVCQALLVAAIAWAAYSTTDFLPYWPVSPNLSATPTYTFQIDFVRCLWVVLPGALLWGASFPLALAAARGDEEDSGKLVGSVYAANTIGGIVGALFGSLLIIAWLGTQAAERVLMATAALSALITLVLLLMPTRGSGEQFQKFGDVTVHYNALASDQLPADVARAYGFSRSSHRGLINIAVQKDDGPSPPQPVPATVKASATNLLGQRVDVAVREIKEDGSVYYLGEFPVAGTDTLRFAVEVTPQGASAPLKLDFSKDYVTD